MTRPNLYVGQPIERIEDLRLLRGRGQFVDDFEAEDQLFAVVLRSAYAHARLRAIDTRAARALPGVHSVITAAELGAAVPRIPVRLFPTPELKPFEQPVLADTVLRYVGEPVAVVLADSVARGEDALELIELDIESLPVVASREAARRGDALLFPAHGSNCAITYRAAQGDAAAAFAGADYVRRERFAVHRHTAVPMEPRGLVARWDNSVSRMTVWGAAKAPFAARRILAAALGLPVEAIDLLELDVGGGFGARGEFYPEDFLIPFAARHTGRPVKWTEDRREHLLTVNHARDAEIELEIACRRDGTILALRGRGAVDAGAYLRTAGTIAPRNLAQFIAGPYRVPHIDIAIDVLLTNKTPSATYRGPGRYEADFFRERLFDMVAKDLAIDRVALRRHNLVGEAEMPYALPAIAPVPNRSEFDSGAYLLTLDRCLAEARWDEKQKLQGHLIDGRRHGLAVGCFIEGGAAGPSENARMVAEPDGRIAVHVGSSAIGQGLETALSQIAADALELPIERIRLLHGSTTGVSDGWGSYHSRSIVMGGSAILLAATELRGLIRAAAGRRLGCAPDLIALADAGASAPGGGVIGLGALAADGLVAEATFRNSKHTYSYGTHVAHVAVDPRTGHIALIDYVAVEDAGRIINPLMLHGQTIGAIVQGLGGTMLEELVYDEAGQMRAGSFADYLLPLASDFPNIRAVSLQLRRSPINPLGAKGAGEGGIIPVGGVIANAVAAALGPLGVEPRDLPLSPARVWQLVRDAAAAR